jgi:hypothetical protein
MWRGDDYLRRLKLRAAVTGCTVYVFLLLRPAVSSPHREVKVKPKTRTIESRVSQLHMDLTHAFGVFQILSSVSAFL